MPASTLHPPADLSPSEYHLWKDAQLLGHFEAWKRERRDNRARIERLEADVRELRALVSQLTLPPASTHPTASAPPPATTASASIPPPTPTPSTTYPAPAPPTSLRPIAEDAESVKESVPAFAGANGAANGNGNGVKWADWERGVEGKVVRSMCDVR